MKPTDQLQRHSSVRDFTDQPISADLIETIVHCGQAASTSSFVQAYSIVRVTQPDDRAVIAEAAGGQSWIESAAEFWVICADLRRLNQACISSGQTELTGITEHSLTAVIDAALMAQNMMVAAEFEGLGGVFIGGIRNNPESVVEALDLPKGVAPLFGLCLGWPASRNSVKPRLPIDMVFHTDRYQDSELHDYDEVMRDYYRERGKDSNWSAPSARALQRKKREHMKAFLQSQGFFTD